MNKLMKRSFSALMAMLLILSLLSGVSFAADAATVNYQYGSAGKYSNVIKNWGIREEVATFLSPNAEAFYEDTTYEELITLNGSSNLTVVDTSALYIALNALMKNAHSKTNSYEDTKTLMAFTDIQNNGITSNKITAFYSGEEVGPDWDSGSTWNREHTWPNSKGGASSSDGGGVNEVDIMMIRPETSSNNSSRGNKAYGVSSGYYNPNLSDTYDVRGDAARTILYVYVRWGTEESEVLNNLWGTDGVMESLDVMLDWIQQDPVDTWEMGRNDSVESITGTRNVFVDYPELAFALFNEDIPSMVTPSGKAGGASYQITARSNNTAYGTVSLDGSVITATPASGYQVAGYQVTSGSATVVQNGNRFTVKATSDCTITINFVKAASYAVRVYENGALKSSQQVQDQQSYTLPAFSGQLPEGYTFLGWSTAELAETNQKPSVHTAGASVTVTSDMSFYAVVSYFNSDAEETDSIWTLVTDASQLSVGSQVIIAANAYDYAISTTQNGNNRGQAAVVKNGDTLTYDTAVAVFTLESGNISGSYAFNTGSGYLYAVNNTSNYLRTQSTMSDGASFYIAPSADGICAVTSAVYVSGASGVGNVPMQYNLQGMFACYPKATQKALSLYVAQSAGGATGYTTSWDDGTAPCQHSDTTTVTVNATCTEDGSVTITCDACGELISTEVLAATGHNEDRTEYTAPTCTEEGYTSFYCSDCGQFMFIEDYEDALGHNYESVVTPPTYTSQGYTTHTCTQCNDSYVDSYTGPLVSVDSWGLILGDDLTVQFKLYVDPSVVSATAFKITMGQSVYTYSASELSFADNYCFISAPVAAPQMGDTITVSLMNGSEVSLTKDYTVLEYAKTILENQELSQYHQLVKEMLNYGAAAQTYFKYNADNLVNAEITGAGESAVPEKAASEMSVTGQADGITYCGATLVFRKKIAVRFYFSGNLENATFYVGNQEYKPVQKNNMSYVEIDDILPQDLDQQITLVVNGTMSIKYGPMNYIVRMSQNGSEQLKPLLKALFNYHLAAQSFLADQ